MKTNQMKSLLLTVLLVAIFNASAQQPNSDSKMIGESQRQASAFKPIKPPEEGGFGSQ
jgi:hypothetical protein